ncbi:uncharacterized protein LOC119603348 [Lucilia sericata]|uniref:uncharacterized protein LOC119603348 n=1 Tax=Lucilia sericata TaxID=13632 RepID=UPI0018A7EB60|nr:uncharacterized protein LOC119603348 [Lucilia sericata]
MSEIKDKDKDKLKVEDTKKDKRKEFASKDKSLTCMNQKRLQLCAWVLLTVGLCIVVTTFYLAIQQNSGYNTSVAADGKLLDDASDLLPINEEDPYSGTGHFSLEDEGLGSNKSGRFSIKLSDLYEAIGKNKNGCQEKLCQIACTNVANVYAAVHEIVKASSCPSIDVLLLEQQDFPMGVLKNYWMASNISFYEVSIRFGNITKIKSNAFNSPLFRNTFVLSLSHMNITKVESGALLGLYSLKYLTIKSHIQKLAPAIFQPVQTTLVNLKLNANLRINGNGSLFGVSYMPNLIYLDLSNNIFNGSLCKHFFKSMPNLKYLIITESQIQHIEKDAFEDLREKLTFVNLSKNFLTTLSAAVLEPILVTQRIAMLNLANNHWICSCWLQELANLYKEYRLQFMEVLYCKAPHHLYGVTLDEVDFEKENCVVTGTTQQDTVEEKEVETVTEPETSTVKSTTSKDYGSGSSSPVENSSDYVQSNELSSTESSKVLKMRCFDPNASGQTSREADILPSDEPIESSVETFSDNSEHLQLPAPTYDFELQLIPENNSVIVSISTPSQFGILVIWFSEQLESSVIVYDETSLDYECKRYDAPDLIVGPLQENTTYTFCLLGAMENDISPFDCLPLYVPPKRQENIWISEDNKQFTIGMLCLIFLLSTIAGALIAYFGIKAYPDLLEGSKNVLVVKKPDQACYVATISETEYQKQNSLKKRKPSTKELAIKKQSSIKLPLPDTPPAETSPSPYRMSVKDLERLSSLKSSSTCFEDTFPNYNFADDEYETPKVCNDEYTAEQRSVPNMYGMSPRSPPPLPKRNSNVSNSPTLVINRFSSYND